MSGETEKHTHDHDEENKPENSGNAAVMRFIEVTSIVGLVAGCAVIGWIAYDTWKRNAQAARRQQDVLNPQHQSAPTAPPNTAPRAAEPDSPPPPPDRVDSLDIDDSQIAPGDGEGSGPTES